MKNLILVLFEIMVLLYSWQVSANTNTNKSFTYDMAVGMVGIKCHKNGLTDVNIDTNTLVTMGKRQFGLSELEVSTLINSPKIQTKILNKADRLLKKINEGKTKCNSIVLYIVGSLMK